MKNISYSDVKSDQSILLQINGGQFKSYSDALELLAEELLETPSPKKELKQINFESNFGTLDNTTSLLILRDVIVFLLTNPTFEIRDKLELSQSAEMHDMKMQIQQLLGLDNKCSIDMPNCDSCGS